MQLIQISEGTAAQRRIFFHAVDATDGITAETGLTGTGFFSKNGATPAASSGSLVEVNATNMPGRYYIEATGTEINTVGIIEFRYKAAACAEVIARAQVVPWDPYSVTNMGLTDLTAILGDSSELQSVLSAGILARANNPTLNALLGVDDVAANHIPNQILHVETLPELPQAQPPVAPTLAECLAGFWMTWRNDSKVSTTTRFVMNAAGVAQAKATMGDDGTDFTPGQLVSGP